MAKSWEDGRWIVTLVSGDEYFVNLDYRNGRREDL